MLTVRYNVEMSTLCGQNGVRDASARENKTRQTKEEVFGCGEGGHA